MHKEIEFFITEYPSIIREREAEKQQAGVEIVHSSEDMLGRLYGMTKPDEEISVGLSGAWLKQCIAQGVTALLSLRNNPKDFQDPVVTALTVDLATCFSYDDFHDRLLPIEQKRYILTTLIGLHAQDERLTILPLQES